MHITNGIGRDFINADFIQFSQNVGNSTSNMEEAKKRLREKLVALNHVELPNYLYLNNGNYTFKDVSDSAGINETSMSNGAAYVDLDNDGDLDLVVNNINKEAFVFINNTIQKKNPNTNHSISFILKGDSLNSEWIWCKSIVYTGGKHRCRKNLRCGDIYHTVDKKLLFGTGKNDNNRFSHHYLAKQLKASNYDS